MRDGFQISRTIAVFHEKALVVFQAVGRADHGIVQTVRVEVFQGLTDPLLEVGGGDNLQVVFRVEPLLGNSPIR